MWYRKSPVRDKDVSCRSLSDLVGFQISYCTVVRTAVGVDTVTVVNVDMFTEGSIRLATGLGWLWFGIFPHLANLLSHFGQFPISPGRTRQRIEQVKIKVNLTQSITWRSPLSPFPRASLLVTTDYFNIYHQSLFWHMIISTGLH